MSDLLERLLATSKYKDEQKDIYREAEKNNVNVIRENRKSRKPELISISTVTSNLKKVSKPPTSPSSFYASTAYDDIYDNPELTTYNKFKNMPKKYIHLFFDDFEIGLYNRYKTELSDRFFYNIQMNALIKTQHEAKVMTNNFVKGVAGNSFKSKYPECSVENILEAFLEDDNNEIDKLIKRIYTETHKEDIHATQEIKSLGEEVSYSNFKALALNSKQIMNAIPEITGHIQRILDRVSDIFNTAGSFVLQDILDSLNDPGTGRLKYTQDQMKEFLGTSDGIVQINDSIVNKREMSAAITHVKKMIMLLSSLKDLEKTIDVRGYVEPKDDGEFLSFIIRSLSDPIMKINAWHAEYSAALALSEAKVKGGSMIESVQTILTGDLLGGKEQESFSCVYTGDERLEQALKQEQDMIELLRGSRESGQKKYGKQLKNDVSSFVVMEDKTVFHQGYTVKSYSPVKDKVFPSKLKLHKTADIMEMVKISRNFPNLGFKDYIFYNLAAGSPGSSDRVVSKIQKQKWKQPDDFQSKSSQDISDYFLQYTKALIMLNLLEYLSGTQTLGDKSLIAIVNGRTYSIYEVITGILLTLKKTQGKIIAVEGYASTKSSENVGIQMEEIKGENIRKIATTRSKKLIQAVEEIKVHNIGINFNNLTLPQRAFKN